jgi:hypothetical protein
MEHKPLAQLQALADVQPADGTVVMPRAQRLQRWIELLNEDPERRLRSLHEFEHLSAAQRRECRADESPLSIAFGDPILRSAGLKSDSAGDCMDFFELNDRQIHHAFCSCHVGIRLSSKSAAQRLGRQLRFEHLHRKVADTISRGAQALFGKQG